MGDSQPTVAQIQGMKYLQNVTREAMRLYHPGKSETRPAMPCANPVLHEKSLTQAPRKLVSMSAALESTPPYPMVVASKDRTRSLSQLEPKSVSHTCADLLLSMLQP